LQLTDSNAAFTRLTGFLNKICGEYFSTGNGVVFRMVWQDGEPVQYGQGTPVFTIVVKDKIGVSALASLDATSILEAYMLDHIDIQGDISGIFAFRNMTTDSHPFRYFWSLAKPLIFGQTRMDRSGIATHYDHPPEFYLAFLDKRHRSYSHGIFLRDDESLEDAMTHKLDFALEQINVKPGDRVLDIGGGWGIFSEYAGKKGIRVTSLTISQESEKYLNALIAREKLPCDVVNCHLYEYHPGISYDAIVNLGVTEHLPDYARTLQVYQRLLRPGGKIYLDASACREKYKFHTFINRYIWQNNTSLLCLHDYLKQLAKTPFQLLGVWDDRWNYYLTAKNWAQNFEARREFIIGQSSEAIFRQFQIYLWGTVDTFGSDIMQAYRWVIQLPD